MSNEYNKIGENICQAVDIITSQKLNDIPYDKTEICTIVKQNEKNDNIYTVTNGVITFDAIVDLNPNSKDTPKYKKNDCVRVLIPNGNYKDTKYITGLHIVDITKPEIYVSPQESIIQLTDNYINTVDNVPEELELKANGQDFYSSAITFYFNKDDMYINNYDKYDTLLLTGDFRTDLSKYNITNGSYGLKLDLYQKNTTDNNEEVTNQTFAVLSNKDMMGNPYSFELDTPQQIKINISSLGQLSHGVLYLYQNKDFEYSNTDLNLEEEIESNLFVRNIKIVLGQDLTKIDTNTFQIFTNESNIYNVDNGQSDTYIKAKNEYELANKEYESAQANYDKTYARYKKGIASGEQMAAADRRLQSAIRIKNETWKNFLQIQRIRIFKPIWYNEDNNKYIGFSNGVYDLNYDEIEYKQELKKRQRFEDALNDISIDCSSDIRGVTLAANLKEEKNIYQSIYNYIQNDIIDKILSTLKNYIVKDKENTFKEIENSLNENQENAKTCQSNIEKFYTTILKFAKEWQNGEKEKTDIPEVTITKTSQLYSIFNTINDLSNKITKDMITDDIYYNNYITQLNYILTKIEPLLNRLKMFEPDSDNSENVENDSVQLRFYLGDITGYNENNPIEEQPLLYQEYFNYNFEDNLYSSDNSDWIKETSNKYCIYWYRYNLNYINEQDKEIAGVGWERVLVDKDNKTVKNLGIPLEEGINGYNQKQDIDISLPLLLSGNVLNEKIKAVLFFNHEQFNSNIIEFENGNPSSSITNLDALKALYITHGEDSREVYQCYGINNYLIKSSDSYKSRYLQINYEGQKGGNECLVGATVTWKIPLSSTMLTFSEEEIKENNFSYSITEKYNIFNKEILAKYDDNGNIIYTEDNKPEVDINTLCFPYHIKDYYNNGFSNNTIMCEVKLMDEEILETSISFNFATGEVNGTSYAFVVSPMTDTICTSSKEENSELLYTPLYLKIELYNEENNQINIPLKNINPKWICCKTNTLEVSGYTFDEDISYYISNTQYIESNYSLSFIVDDNTIENPNVIGCRIIPLKSYGGPAIIQFEIKSINISDNTYNFTTYYAVPWCPYGESLYIEGGNTIVYDSFGTNAKYYNEKYKLRYAKNGIDNNKEYEKDDEVPNISWKMRYYTYNNTHYDGNYSYVDCENDKDIPSNKIKEGYELLLSYMPKLKDNKLYVSPMYLDGLLESKDYNLYPAVIAYNEKNQVLWIQPIILMQNTYGSNMLNSWNGEFMIDEEGNKIFSSILGAGRKTDVQDAQGNIVQPNVFEGVLMGDLRSDNQSSGIGLYGYHEGTQSFGFKIDGTAFIGKTGTGRINFNGKEATIESANFTNGQGMKINLLQGTLNISYNSNNNDNFTWLQVNKNKDGNNNTVFKIDGNGQMFAEAIELHDVDKTKKEDYNNYFIFNADNLTNKGERFELYTNKHTPGDTNYGGIYLGERGFSFWIVNQSDTYNEKLAGLFDWDAEQKILKLPLASSIQVYVGSGKYLTLPDYIKEIVNQNNS